MQCNDAFQLLRTIVLEHCHVVSTDFHVLRISFSDGVVQALRNQKHFLMRMLRTVRES